ncbi:MAG TPA: ABC transporter ATP-binding protein [Campylobacterales bacterium]|nr:ABC transporter ATP-binding protein [Campylobacterales bacterium]
MSLLEVCGLNKKFADTQVLSNINFSIFKGEIVGLIGPNGAGKTTMLESMCGLQPTDGGEVFFEGRKLPPWQLSQAIFYVPDGITPYPEHTLGSLIKFFSQVYGIANENVEKVITALELQAMLGRPIVQLSKGWRRRLLLAIGLITPQPLLIMDEPFDGLDLRQTRAVMQNLKEFAAAGRSLLLSIHQLTDAQRICDRFVLLSNGQILGEGTLEDLRIKSNIDGSLEEVFLELSK